MESQEYMPYFLTVQPEYKKGWDTCRLNYYLAHISSNEKIKKVNKTEKTRKNSKSVPPPADGHPLLSVEDDLTHHIR